MDDNWVIYWQEYSADTHLYGSNIIYHCKDNVEYDNAMTAPGTIIKQWYSKTDFQIQKIEPSLPLIDGENKYQIIINMDCNEGEHYLFRLVYYDKYDNEVGYTNIHNQVTDFKCPIQTYSYRLQLINSGLTHFCFHYVILRDITQEK